MRALSYVKQRVLSAGRCPRRVPFGLFRGLRLDLDLRSETQLYVGLWERETYAFIRRAAPWARWMVDVGAGRGELFLYFLARSPAERLYAFEPRHEDTDVLRRNLALNETRPARIVVENRFVGPSSASGRVALDSLGLDPDARGFLKVDVDGFEMEVLRSADALLTRGRVDVLIETHSADLERECTSWLCTRGYAVTVLENAWWRSIIPDYRAIEHN